MFGSLKVHIWSLLWLESDDEDAPFFSKLNLSLIMIFVKMPWVCQKEQRSAQTVS